MTNLQGELHTWLAFCSAPLLNCAVTTNSWLILMYLFEMLCEQAFKLFGRHTGCVNRHSISESSSGFCSPWAKSRLSENTVWLCASVRKWMLCRTDSEAVASSLTVCFSITLIVTELSLISFDKGANQHSTGNEQPNGTFRSLIETQY